MFNDYFDLTDTSSDVDSIKIVTSGGFNCRLTSVDETKTYKGFVLAKTPQGNVATICDIDFHWSDTDGKYQPRPVFRRVDRDLQDKLAKSNAKHIRISFHSGAEGYREFWKMINFLRRYKETIDTGDFEDKFQVVSKEGVVRFLNDKTDPEQLGKDLEGLNITSSSELNAITTLRLLKDVKEKLDEFISSDASETDVQNWIDEDNHVHRQRRCLIFGLEYLNFYREGFASSKKFDILTRIGTKSPEHVLIELKGPSEDLFRVSESSTINEKTSEFQLSDSLARSIPQILEYKSILETKQAEDPDLQRIGLTDKKITIAKCIVVIGKNREDARWKRNKTNFQQSLNSSLEVWTYSELLNKLDSTIENLEYKDSSNWVEV